MLKDKRFSIGSEGNERPSSRGKGFPRHLYKKIVGLDEETAEEVSYGYTGNRYVGEPVRMSMNRSYGNLAEWGHCKNWVKSNHISRWLQKHVGQNIDTVHSEFLEMFKASKVSGDHDADYYFWDKIWDETHTRGSRKHRYYVGYKTWYEFEVDNQGRLQRNPEYKAFTRNKKKVLYDAMFVRDNKKALQELETKKISSSALGPIGIKTQMWIIHPDTGLPVKMPVYLVRSNIWGPIKPNRYLDYTVDSKTLPKPSDKQVEYIKDNYRKVSVIWDVYGAKDQWTKDIWPYESAERSPWWRKEEYMIYFNFVVPKSLL